MLENGMIVDGKYKILNKIGRGGMSTVYLAMNERANRQWAIKEIQKKGNRYYRTMREELLAETDILKRLDHPNLPKIADVLEYKDIFLIVMDYIEGRPLSLTLQEQGAQSQEVVVAWAKQLCDVLEYLHSRKPPIIYRDMKPANIMLRPDGRVMLIDFGTAREYKEEHVEDTICLGTVGYAAPEQFGGNGQTDARTDIFCLGRTLYHLLTGHNPCMPPYEIYPIRHWNPQLSSGLEEIIWKCVQNDPQERYQSCAELLYALEHYREFDVECKRQQQKKWRIFVCSAVCTLAFAAGAVGFRCAEEKTVRNSYERVMKEASSSVTREKQIEYFKGCLMATGREGVEDLLDFIEELGFYDAPASGGNHCCKDGGLLEHTVNVMQYAEKIGLTLLGSEAYNKIHSSVIIASALHDLGKCGRYGSPYYVENMVQDGRPTKKNPEQKYKRSESKPYKISSDLCHIDHPLRSVELAARYIDLTEEEEHAIFYHDGAYGSLAYDLKGHEEPLQVIIHFADFWSAQFLEVGKLDRFNDQVKSEETTDEVKEEGENNEE